MDIYIRQAAEICQVNPKTFEKFVQNGLIKPVRSVPRVIKGKIRDMRLFDIDDVKKFAKTLPKPKDRQKGQPLVIFGRKI